VRITPFPALGPLFLVTVATCVGMDMRLVLERVNALCNVLARCRSFGACLVESLIFLCVEDLVLVVRGMMGVMKEAVSRSRFLGSEVFKLRHDAGRVFESLGGVPIVCRYQTGQWTQVLYTRSLQYS